MVGEAAQQCAGGGITPGMGGLKKTFLQSGGGFRAVIMPRISLNCCFRER